MSHLTFPNIDPVFFSIGPFAIRWYALSYIAGIFLGSLFLNYLNKKPPQVFTEKALDDLLLYAVMGIILGGRLGYVLFYNPVYYFTNPVEIIQIWQGGMSFHGGLVGLATALYLVCRKYHIDFLPATDLLVCVAPIGIALGRIANFINGELYGRVTDSPLGMVFPSGGPLPRHPSQLYEALLEGVLLFFLLSILVLFTRARHKTGLLTGMFLLGYASARSFIEYFREPDPQLGFLFGQLTMGQLLSVPMVILGIIFVARGMVCQRS